MVSRWKHRRSSVSDSLETESPPVIHAARIGLPEIDDGPLDRAAGQSADGARQSQLSGP
jgi:hypothetical protein